MTSVCVIPARGGSKRVPRKNVRDFAGKPMIAWPIHAALESGCFAHVIVSTDDAEIAQVARLAGAEVPFMRPAELSDDYATTLDVMRHAALFFMNPCFLSDSPPWNRGGLGGGHIVASQEPPPNPPLFQGGENWVQPEFICCLYATAPFVTADDLRKGREALIKDQNADYTFSVAAYPHPVQRALRVNAAGRMEMLYPEHATTRSQDLEAAHHDAGAFYWGRTKAWAEKRPVLGPLSMPLVLPSHRVCDIDTPEDWERAEVLAKALWAQ